MKPKNAVRLDRTIGRWVYRFHLFIYRLTFGLIGHRTSQGPVLLLTTLGRKSGTLRTTPLLYMPDESTDPQVFYVVGSNGGRPNAPGWILNLGDHSSCVVQAGRRSYLAVGEVLDDVAKAEIWPELTEYYSGWSYYETLTDREIHPVRLKVVRTVRRDEKKSVLI